MVRGAGSSPRGAEFQDLDEAALVADENGAGFLYLTDHSGDNPYGRLPLHWD